MTEFPTKSHAIAFKLNEREIEVVMNVGKYALA